MVLDLSEIEFTYDFFTSVMPNGNQLVLNLVDEDFIATSIDDGGNTIETETKIHGVNIYVEFLDSEQDNALCSSVIGTSNDYFTLSSEHSEYLGQTLTTENMKYCTIEMYEEEDE